MARKLCFLPPWLLPGHPEHQVAIQLPGQAAIGRSPEAGSGLLLPPSQIDHLEALRVLPRGLRAIRVLKPREVPQTWPRGLKIK